MENIKLILADIDGTLLNSSQKVTQLTREEIAKLKEKGILFGIATGRSPYAVRHLIEEWDIAESVSLIMGFNGGMVMDMRNGETFTVLPIDGRAIPQIQEDLKDFDFNLGLYEGETFICLRDLPLARRVAASNRFAFVHNDLSGYVGQKTGKLLVMAEKEEMDRIVEYCEKLPPSDLYHTFRSGPSLLECVNPGLSKSKGIAFLREKLGVAPEELMTFGDAMNDFDMIRDYVGVAMANADERVKAVARYITASNDEDGIGVFLKEHF